MSDGLRVLSYNIHKGFSATNLSYVLKKLKRSIHELGADLVLLQEVIGESSKRKHSQFEYLADELWPHFAYGKNAVYTSGHHGNAILSRFPIRFWENQDVSPSRIERRGLLHAELEMPDGPSLHVICVHLALFESARRSQLLKLCRRIDAMVPGTSPLIVGGDFNDWRERASGLLESKLGLKEAFLTRTGDHARTFPSWLPALKLDRLYFRGLHCERVELAQSPQWKSLSDHLPIMVDLTHRTECPKPPR